MRNPDDLHPELREKICILKKLCENQGLLIGIGECLRTKEEQDALYRKGRTSPGKIVTNASGKTYSSMHQWGVAFDFYRNDGCGAYNDSDGFFKKVGEIGKSIGLMWGGDWKNPVDKPHFQLSDWGSTPKKLKEKYKTPENFISIWEKAMTENEKKAFQELQSKVAILEREKERIYHYSTELPEWASPTIDKLVRMGIYQGSSNADLNLPESLMRVLVINDRAGLYR